MNVDRSIGALVFALVAVGFLAFAFVQPWFSYEHTSGRQTAPDGPYADQPMPDTAVLHFYAFDRQGDVEPTDPEKATLYQDLIGWSFVVAALGLLIVLLAEIPGFWNVFTRPVSLVGTGLAFSALATSLTITWWLLPDTMSGYGITWAFTYFLVEPDGYTRSTLNLGWVAGLLGITSILFAGLYKYQAGSYDPGFIKKWVDRRKARST